MAVKPELSLLEKAKSIPAKKRNRAAPSGQEIELWLSFLHGEITTAQICGALGIRTTNVQQNMLSFIRRAIDNKLIVIRKG